MQKILCVAEAFYQHWKQADNNGEFFKVVYFGLVIV